MEPEAAEPPPDPPADRVVSLGGRDVLVRFLPHAADRMRQRGIDPDQVIQVLRFPDERKLDASAPGRLKWGRWEVTPRRWLDVVFAEESADPRVLVVISAMWGR